MTMFPRTLSRMASRALALGGIGLLGITTNAAAQATWTMAQPVPDRAQPAPDPANTVARVRTQVGQIGGADVFVGSFAPFEMGPMMMEMQDFSLQGGKVAGAPYSAEAVTEMTQTLGDGNRIVRSVTASVARDSEGRTRREQVLAAFGPWMPADQPKSVIINDPVAGVSYMLHDKDKVAVKMPAAMSFKVEGAADETRVMVGGKPMHDPEQTFHYKIEGKDAPPPPPPPPPPPGVAGEAGMTVVAPSAGAVGIGAVSIVTSDVEPFVPGAPGAPVRENAEQKSLGTQVIEGVEANGTQTIVTIPAGAIGNEQPIKIVSEQWYSPALQVVVLSKRSDPRSGEMVYRLTQLDRSEPAASLFQVPSDYTIKDVMTSKIRRERKATPEQEQQQ